jgi:hypothetical protein
MAAPDWETGAPPCLALHATAAIEEATDEVVVCVNGRHEVVEFALPSGDAAYVEALSSFDPSRRGAHHRGGGRLAVPERSVLVLVAAEAGG